MRALVSQLHRGLAWLTLAGLLIQLYLAGAAAFGATSFAVHAFWGHVLGLIVIILAILAVVGGLGRQRIVLSTLLFVLYIVQYALAEFRFTVPYAAALHAVNALAVLGTTARLARAEPSTKAGTLQTAGRETELVVQGEPRRPG